VISFTAFQRAGSCGWSLRWPFDKILTGLEEGLRRAAHAAPEGVASIAVDGWAVDYVRLGENGKPLANPHCYRDERTIATKEAADKLALPDWMFRHAGAQPLRINTVYQLLADPAAGIDPRAPWINLPEYVTYHLGGRRVAEYTNATHTGLVDIETGNWPDGLMTLIDLSREAAAPLSRWNGGWKARGHAELPPFPKPNSLSRPVTTRLRPLREFLLTSMAPPTFALEHGRWWAHGSPPRS
jgi:sugar (pentulose or hexulose) kinase